MAAFSGASRQNPKEDSGLDKQHKDSDMNAAVLGCQTFQGRQLRETGVGRVFAILQLRPP